MSQKATKGRPKPTTPNQSAQGTAAGSKGSTFRPYVPLNATSTSNKRKRVDDRHEEKELFDNFTKTLGLGASKPAWVNGTDAAAVTTTASQKNLSTIENVGTADGGLEKLKKKDRKAKKARSPESGIVPEDETGVAEEGKKKKISKPTAERDIAGNSTLKDATMKNEDITQSGEEAVGKKKKKKMKKKKRKEAAADNAGQDSETRTDLKGGSFSSLKTQTKKVKKSKSAEGGVKSLTDASGLDEGDADRTQLDNLRNDNDWLRARTNRILDLIGDNEVPMLVSAPASSESSGSASNDSGHGPEPQIHASSSAVEHDLEESLANGRLFIRNLPYSASEADIEDLFAKYGKLNEVSDK